MAVLELTADDLAATRFALSPMAELLGALHVLGGRHLPPGLDRWARQARPQYLVLRQGDEFFAALVDLMCVTNWLPDFIGRPRPNWPPSAACQPPRRERTCCSAARGARLHPGSTATISLTRRRAPSAPPGTSFSPRTGPVCGGSWNEMSSTGPGCWPPTAGGAPSAA